MKEITVTGATVEEALASACEQLGIDTESAQYEVIEQPQPKILGLFGGVDAKVRVFVEEPQKKTPTQAAVDYLTEILTAMGVKNLEITDEATDERTILNINFAQLLVHILHKLLQLILSYSRQKLKHKMISRFLYISEGDIKCRLNICLLLYSLHSINKLRLMQLFAGNTNETICFLHHMNRRRFFIFCPYSYYIVHIIPFLSLPAVISLLQS